MTDETWGDPNPAGLFAVGAGTTAVWAALTGQTGPGDLPILIVWLLAAGLVQTIVGIILFRRGDPLGGSLNLAFGILFFGAPAVAMALTLGAPPEAPVTLVMNGWIFFVLGAVLVAFIPIMATQSVLSMGALIVFSCAVMLLALLNIRPPAEQAIAPWPTVASTAGWLIGARVSRWSTSGSPLPTSTPLGARCCPSRVPIRGREQRSPPSLTPWKRALALRPRRDPSASARK